MKKHWIVLILIVLLTASCVSKHTEDNQDIEISEDVQNELDDSVGTETENVLMETLNDNLKRSVSNEDNISRNYYNKEICYMNGRYYCLRDKGLYMREDNSTEWNLLFETSLILQKSIETYEDALYFMVPDSSEDAEKISVSKTLVRFDPDSIQAEKIMQLDEQVVDITIYNSVLYLENAGITSSSVWYEAWILNENGKPETKLDENSPEFICQTANEYQRADEKNNANSYMPDLPKEVIPTPDCASMLCGFALYSEIHDELNKDYYLYSVESGEKELLFTAPDFFMVTEEGIYYWGENIVELFYYDFKNKSSNSLLTVEEAIGLYPLTYDENWLYIYQIGESVFKISRNTGSIEELEQYQLKDVPWCAFVDNGNLYLQ